MKDRQFIRAGRMVFAPLVIALLLALSACSVSIPGGGGSSGTSNLTPLQVLQKSADAMQTLKSSHIDLKSNTNVETTGATPAATPTIALSPLPSSSPSVPTVGPGTATPTASNLSVAITGSGDEQLPNQEQLSLSVNTLNQNLALAQIVQDDKVYVKNPQGQWFVLNKSDFQGFVGNPMAGINLDQNSLLGLMLHTQIVDHGDEVLNGETLRHITANLDKVALRQLLLTNPQLQSAIGAQNIDTVVDHLQSFDASIDVWIDGTQFFLHRTQLKLNLLADLSGSTAPAVPHTVKTTVDTTVDLSKFNVPVSIVAPANATPTDNPGAIFGIGKP